jgi:hypothetical protein
MSEIAVMLNQLAAFEAERNTITEKIMAEPWASGVVCEYAKLQERIGNATAQHGAIVATLRQEIETATLALGETVRGAELMAVWSKPRVAWDGKILDGFAFAHPELLAARHVGQPSVIIRAVRRE